MFGLRSLAPTQAALGAQQALGPPPAARWQRAFEEVAKRSNRRYGYGSKPRTPSEHPIPPKWYHWC